MPENPFAENLTKQRAYFLRTVSCFRSEHAAFTPAPGMFSVAAQIAHAAITVEWFLEGAFRPQGFDLDFTAHETAARNVVHLDVAIKLFSDNYSLAITAIERLSMDELHIPIPPGPIMGGAPRLAIISAMADHTAHHRGSLATYGRLLGLTPSMPYA